MQKPHIFFQTHNVLKEFSCKIEKIIKYDYINFIRLYSNNDYIHFGNKPHVFYDYCKTFCTNIPYSESYHSLVNYDFILWDLWQRNDVSKLRTLNYMSEEHSLFNWSTLVFYKGEYVDTISFATNENDLSINTQFLLLKQRLIIESLNFIHNCSLLIGKAERKRLRLKIQNRPEVADVEKIDKKGYFIFSNLLTKKENIVLGLLIKSMTTNDIASCLNNSQNTIKCHVENIKSKLGCYLKSDLIKKMNTNNLIKFVIKDFDY